MDTDIEGPIGPNTNEPGQNWDFLNNNDVYLRGGSFGGGGGGGGEYIPPVEPPMEKPPVYIDPPIDTRPIDATILTPENPVPDIIIKPSDPIIKYELSITSNLKNEIGDFISLNYDIAGPNQTIDRDTLKLSAENTDGKSALQSLLKLGILNISLNSTLPSNYSIKKIYYANRNIAEKNQLDYTKWNTGDIFIGLPASELLTGGLAIAVIVERVINQPKPTIFLNTTNYSKQIKDSDNDTIVNIEFTQLDSDYIDFYLSETKVIRVTSNKTNCTLSFLNNFDGIYGNKKIIAVPYSDLYGTGDKVEITINFIAVNDFPSITEIQYTDVIDIPAYSDFNIDYNVKYSSFAATSVDVYLQLKAGSRTKLFGNQPANGELKINLQKLRETYTEWVGSNDIILTLIPYNRGGEEELIGNEYEIKTSLLYPVLQLDETIIKKSIFDAFVSNMGFSEPEKESKYLTHLINFGNDEQIIISSWETDNWSLSKKSIDELGNEYVKPEDEVGSLILKLYNPLPANVQKNSTFWITKLMSNPLIETIILNEESVLECPPIKGPNFNIDVDYVTGKSTNYESLDNLILNNSISSSSNLVSTYLSSSLFSTSELNIDYVSGSTYLWDNFVHFSSATERVLNFQYKVKLIEAYENSISSSQIASIVNSPESVKQVERNTIKKNQIIQSFDGFETFLYTSSSYTTNTAASITWPYNSGVNGKRILSNDTIVGNWSENIITLAERFDVENSNNIKNNIPQYILNNSENDSYLLFFAMIGQHFDNIYYHTKSIEKSRGLGYKAKDGISDKLLFDVLKSFNWDAQNLAADEQLWSYVFGEDTDGNTQETNPAKQRTLEVWRRIVNNLPYLLKHKGSRRGIYALLSCYGIPSSNLSIFEFGGPEVNDISKSKLVYDNVTTALKMTLTSSIEMDWKTTDKGSKPNTIELFLNPTYISDSTIISGSNWNVKLSGSIDSEYGKVIFNYSGSEAISSSLLPIFNDRFFGLSVSSGSTGLKLDVRQANKERTIFEQSITASVSSSWNTGSKIKLGGYYSGSVDEFRLWSEVLDTDRFYEHVSFPEMINGNSISASTSDLYFRLDFEYPKNLALTSSLINVDTNIYFSASLNRNNFENGLNIITGSISNITIINGGTGYTSSLGTSNGSIPLYFVGGEFKQTQPSVTGSLTNGVLTSISISHGGTGMVSFPNNLQPSASLSQSINNSITPIVIELTGSVANFVSENITPLLFATASGFTSVTSYPYQFEAIDRTVVLEIPDMGSTRYSTNKVRFESQTDFEGNDVSGGVDLSLKSRATKKAFDQSPTDSNRVGLFFSPTKELNIDIAKSFGGINLDNYIGDPSDDYKPNYKSLDNLRNYYFQRFDGRDIYAYINLIKLYEKSMFEDIKKMLPARVKATTGLLIEPHILERSKITQKKPTGDEYQQEAEIHYGDTTTLTGDNSQYESIINANLSEDLIGENYQYEGEIFTASIQNVIGENYQYEGRIFTSSIQSVIAENYQYEVSADAGLGEPTFQTEIDVINGTQLVGQTAYEEIGFEIYASNGNAIRTYFNTDNKVVKERVRINLITEQKNREVLSYNVKVNGKGDPRGGYYLSSSVYTETTLNIQPFSGSVIPEVKGKIIAVQPVNGYLPTHYRNTSDLTTGMMNSYFKGSKNTAATTLDGSSPIETFVSNPNTLTVNKTGRSTSEPILEVE
jgi:hypothetical protein